MRTLYDIDGSGVGVMSETTYVHERTLYDLEGSGVGTMCET